MNTNRPRILRSMGLLVTLLAGAHCGDASMPQKAMSVPLDSSLTWHGNNAQRLNDFMAQVGLGGPNYDAQHKPVAVFDWDNTIIKNDIGDATLFYMLNTDKVLQPPMKNWRLTSPFMTAEAATALNTACDALASAGQPLPTATAAAAACANEIFSIYDSRKTTGGKAAFSGYNYRRIEPSYAWAVQLQAGYAPTQIHAFTEAAIAFNMASPVGTMQSVGDNTGLNGYIRIYAHMRDLIAKLQQNGFDVWISSASAQPAVEAFAGYVNISADHVIGVRMLLDGAGKQTYNIQGCGDVPDGSNDGAGNFSGNSMITYVDGKRCWINKVIWKNDTASAVEKTPDATQRQVFAAGDSNTDVTFVRDATVLKLIINRNKKELMCNGYANFGGQYLINPMFIDPLPALGAGYPCSTTGCVNEKGISTPCYDEGSPPMLISDQVDAVFGP